MRNRAIAISLGAALCFGLTAAYAALPGPHRALTPGVFGLAEAGPGLWVDDPAFAAQVRAFAARADETVADFFGPLESHPRFIFCTAPRCADIFGLKRRGLTCGAQLIFVGPKGQNEMIVTHERTHGELHRSLRLSDLWDQRIPAWFDEGLASYLSDDTRLDSPENPRDANWICAARTFRDWGRLHPAQDWRQTYGAAARLVAEIDQIAGRDGLRDLVTAVEAGASFDGEYARLVPAAMACAPPPS